MKQSTELQQLLSSIHRKSYPAYKSLKGIYDFRDYVLSIDHVQGDPFASPSHLSVRVPLAKAGFPVDYYGEEHTRIALQDYLNRQFYQQVQRFTFKAKGSGKSGLISVSRCGQEILDRTACQIGKRELILRFAVGFPANGRTINAPELEKILFDFLPKCVKAVCYYRSLPAREVEQVIFLSRDQHAIREELKKRDLAAFVANGSILPRESGVSSLPMKGSVPFISPESLEVEMFLPYKGKIRGMGIPRGITLIVGGGYHGKSTLLNALEVGIYDHIAGDGREYVIADDTAVKLRAEDGRSVRNVDISLFINDLPNKKDTHSFSTPDASGSTSQAAAIVESMEAGSRLFLIDEDTSATNFMVRDDFMQQVICRAQEPITPFLERVRELYEEAGVSTILVAGSSGAFFHVADTVIQMESYRALDITKRVKELCLKNPVNRTKPAPFALPGQRKPMELPRQEKPRMGRDYQGRSLENREERLKVKVRDKDEFLLGRETVDLRYVEQLVDYEQTAALAQMLKYAREHCIDGRRNLSQVAETVLKQMEKRGMEAVCDGSYVPGGLAAPRRQEWYACLNRYRG